MNTGSSRGAAIRRGLTATVMMAAAGLTTLGATAAHAATTMPAAHIHKAACTNATLNVAQTTGSRVCFRGTGAIKVDIPFVRQVTTGDNTGWLAISERHESLIIHFKPHRILSFLLPSGAKITVIDIVKN
jgi:hypothetical protein